MNLDKRAGVFHAPAHLKELLHKRLALIKKREKAGNLKLEELTDEDLHLIGALHDRRYWGDLFKRYEGDDVFLAYATLGRAHVAKMDPQDIESLFLTSFMKALNNYVPGRCKFRTYFNRIFQNALLNLLRKDDYLNRSKGYLSLSHPVPNDPETPCLCDIIPSSFPAPEEEVEVAEQLEFLLHLPPQFDPWTARIIQFRMEGLPVTGIAKKLRCTIYRVKNAIRDVQAYLASSQAQDLLGLDRSYLKGLASVKANAGKMGRWKRKRRKRKGLVGGENDPSK